MDVEARPIDKFNILWPCNFKSQHRSKGRPLLSLWTFHFRTDSPNRPLSHTTVQFRVRPYFNHEYACYWKHLVSREVFCTVSFVKVWKCENGEIKRDKSKIWFTGDDLNSSLGVVLLNDSSKVQTVTTREVPEVNTYFDSLILPNLAPEILLNH